MKKESSVLPEIKVEKGIPLIEKLGDLSEKEINIYRAYRKALIELKVGESIAIDLSYLTTPLRRRLKLISISINGSQHIQENEAIAKRTIGSDKLRFWKIAR